MDSAVAQSAPDVNKVAHTAGNSAHFVSIAPAVVGIAVAVVAAAIVGTMVVLVAAAIVGTMVVLVAAEIVGIDQLSLAVNEDHWDH